MCIAKDKDFSGWIQVKLLALIASLENYKEIFDLKSKGGNCHQHTLAKPTFLILHWPMYEVPLLISNQIWLNNFLQMLIVLRSTLTASMTSNSKQKGLSSLLILYQARTLKGPFDYLLTSLSLMLILSQFGLVTYLHSSFKGCYSSGEVPAYSRITLGHVWASHIPLILNTFAKFSSSSRIPN